MGCLGGRRGALPILSRNSQVHIQKGKRSKVLGSRGSGSDSGKLFQCIQLLYARGLRAIKVSYGSKRGELKHLETKGRLNSRAVFTRTTSPGGRNRPSQFQFSPTNCLPEGLGYKKCRISSSHPETRFHTPTCAVLQRLISLPMPPQPNNCHGELGKSQTFIEEGGYFEALRRSLDSEEPGAGVGVRKVLVSAERVYQCSHSADSALPSAEQALLTRLNRSSGGNGTSTSQGVHPG